MIFAQIKPTKLLAWKYQNKIIPEQIRTIDNYARYKEFIKANFPFRKFRYKTVYKKDLKKKYHVPDRYYNFDQCDDYTIFVVITKR